MSYGEVIFNSQVPVTDGTIDMQLALLAFFQEVLEPFERKPVMPETCFLYIFSLLEL